MSVGQTIQGSVRDASVQVSVNGSAITVGPNGVFSFVVPQTSTVIIRAENGNDICTEEVQFTPSGVQGDGFSGGGRGSDDCPCGDYSLSTRDLRCVADGEEEGEYEELYCTEQDTIEEEEEILEEENSGPPLTDERPL